MQGRRSQQLPPIIGTAQNIDDRRRDRNERISKEISNNRTALELATGLDLADHILSGENRVNEEEFVLES